MLGHPQHIHAAAVALLPSHPHLGGIVQWGLEARSHEAAEAQARVDRRGCLEEVSGRPSPQISHLPHQPGTRLALLWALVPQETQKLTPGRERWPPVTVSEANSTRLFPSPDTTSNMQNVEDGVAVQDPGAGESSPCDPKAAGMAPEDRSGDQSPGRSSGPGVPLGAPCSGWTCSAFPPLCPNLVPQPILSAGPLSTRDLYAPT